MKVSKNKGELRLDNVSLNTDSLHAGWAGDGDVYVQNGAEVYIPYSSSSQSRMWACTYFGIILSVSQYVGMAQPQNPAINNREV